MSLGASAAPRPPSGQLHIWCSADQADLVASVVEALRREDDVPTAVCGLDGTQTGTLASALGVRALDDPRLLGRFEPGVSPEEVERLEPAPLTGQLKDVVWLAADASLPRAAIKTLAGQVPVVVSSMPGMESAPLWSQLRPAGTFRSRLTDPQRAQVLLEIGEVHALHLDAASGPTSGGLGWRVFDAVDLATALLGPIESVAACLVDAAGHPQRPNGLRLLQGTLGALLRDRAGRPATLSLGTSARSRRRALIVGRQGHLELVGGDLHWFDHRGNPIDRLAAAPKASDNRHPAAEEIAEALRQARAGRDLMAGLEPPLLSMEQFTSRLAVCEALRLSTLTGAMESVESVRSAVELAG